MKIRPIIRPDVTKDLYCNCCYHAERASYEAEPYCSLFRFALLANRKGKLIKCEPCLLALRQACIEEGR